jgi:hypothetical protein
MHRLWFPEHGLRIAFAALAALAIAPAAAADDGLPVTADPAALAAVLVQPAVTDPTALDPTALVATVTEALPDELPTLPATQAVPAAAAKPMPALEPQPTPLGTPPPPQPAVNSEAMDTAPDPIANPSQKLDSSPKPQPTAVAEAQYQPEAPQYQPLPSAAAPPEPATVPVEDEFTWNGPPNCDVDASPTALVATVDGTSPGGSNGNAPGYCGESMAYFLNNVPQNVLQYHSRIARYQPLSVNVAVQTVGAVVENPVALVAEIVLAGAEALIAAVQRPPPASAEPIAPAGAPAPDPSADPAKPDAANRRAATGDPPALLNTKLSSNWAPRSAMPRRLQRTRDGHRSRSPLRQLTRRPLPPLRGPVIPVSSSGAAPLGGADGGGSHTLLLAPFALALVDSARRIVRDAAPPVSRERDKRRKRPG